jgi:hypothetical protein
MRYARPLIAGSAALLAATLGATVAFAATTWTSGTAMSRSRDHRDRLIIEVGKCGQDAR